jgi:hypothetical protein
MIQDHSSRINKKNPHPERERSEQSKDVGQRSNFKLSYPAAEAAPPWQKMAGKPQARWEWRRGPNPVNL